MSGTTAWTPDKVASVASQLAVHTSAIAALKALGEPGATARVNLTVGGAAGAQTFVFDMNVADALGFFTPVVNSIGDALTAQGVTLPTGQ